MRLCIVKHHARRREHCVARWNADQSLSLPDLPPALLCSLTESRGPTLVPSYCLSPKTGDKDILGVTLIWWKKFLALTAISLDGQPPPRSTTHVWLRLSTAKGLSLLAECFDSEAKQNRSIRSGCESQRAAVGD